MMRKCFSRLVSPQLFIRFYPVRNGSLRSCEHGEYCEGDDDEVAEGEEWDEFILGGEGGEDEDGNLGEGGGDEQAARVEAREID